MVKTNIADSGQVEYANHNEFFRLLYQKHSLLEEFGGSLNDLNTFAYVKKLKSFINSYSGYISHYRSYLRLIKAYIKRLETKEFSEVVYHLKFGLTPQMDQYLEYRKANEIVQNQLLIIFGKVVESMAKRKIFPKEFFEELKPSQMAKTEEEKQALEGIELVNDD